MKWFHDARYQAFLDMRKAQEERLKETSKAVEEVVDAHLQSSEEFQLILYFRDMQESDRNTLLRIAKALKESSTEG